ncbi:MAG: hypothetical protein IIA58_03610 [Candidatus Marinimicrobia bacterium]|nr:hypothetical protein [Candidatus Neomarinimicrobiota bacterium]
MNFSEDECEGCQISRGENTEIKGRIISLDEYWVLNHYSSKQAFLGWLALQPRNHRMELTDLKREELIALGIHIQNIEMGLRQYWSIHFKDDLLERVYVVYFFEGIFDKKNNEPDPCKFHLHFHLIPRPNSFDKTELLREDEKEESKTTINAWNIYKLNQCEKYQEKLRSDYKLNFEEESAESEQKVSALMEFLMSYFAGRAR